MIKQTISLGAGYDSGDGNKLRDGGQKINDNFDHLFDSGDKIDITSFENVGGDYINSPNSPWTSSVINLEKTISVNGGISSIWYKGEVLSKDSFTGGVIVMFSGLNVLNELCRVFVDYHKTSGAFSVNIQTGFTGDLPPISEASATAPIITVTDPVSATAPVITVT